MNDKLNDKLEELTLLIQLLRREIDKFRIDFFEIRTKIDNIENKLGGLNEKKDRN